MLSRSRKKEVVKPLNTLIQTVASEKTPMPAVKDILVANQQPKVDTVLIEQEMQALRQGQQQNGHEGTVACGEQLALALVC
jgi:hypothetical protein